MRNFLKQQNQTFVRWNYYSISEKGNQLVNIVTEYCPIRQTFVNPDNPSGIHLGEVVHVTVKSIVIINGEEVEIKNLDDREALADRINASVLLERNYVIEKPA